MISATPVQPKGTPTSASPAILVGMPTRGNLSTETFTAFVANNDGYRLVPITSARLPVVEARNRIAAQMLATPNSCPWPVKPSEWFVLWVDSDAWWPPDTISTAVDLLKRHPGVDLLAGCFSLRESRSGVVALPKTNGRRIRWERGELLECDQVGGHFLMHKLSLLDRVGPNPFDRIGTLTEDNSFSERVRKVGGNVFLALGLTVAHVDQDSGWAFIPCEDACRVEGNRLVRTGEERTAPKLIFRDHGFEKLTAGAEMRFRG